TARLASSGGMGGHRCRPWGRLLSTGQSRAADLARGILRARRRAAAEFSAGNAVAVHRRGRLRRARPSRGDRERDEPRSILQTADLRSARDDEYVLRRSSKPRRRRGGGLHAGGPGAGETEAADAVAGGCAVLLGRRRPYWIDRGLPAVLADVAEWRAAARRPDFEPQVGRADERQRHRRSGPRQLPRTRTEPARLRLRVGRPSAQEARRQRMARQRRRLRVGWRKRHVLLDRSEGAADWHRDDGDAGGPTTDRIRSE